MNPPHDALIQIDGHLYFADGNFASFEFKFVNGSNINLVAYSQTLKEKNFGSGLIMAILIYIKT